MSNLRKEQSRFALAIAFLYLEIEKRGWEGTKGDAYRDERVHGKIGEKMAYGHKNSLHKIRLAEDVNLFIDGQYQTGATGHRELHEWWVKQFKGSPMIEDDPNHYSFPWKVNGVEMR